MIDPKKTAFAKNLCTSFQKAEHDVVRQVHHVAASHVVDAEAQALT